MTHYDLFNGDADGICALQQLRLAKPVVSELITGIKREINLFQFINPEQGDSVTALDISFDKNRDGVQSAIDAGAKVFYADHHYAGEMIESDRLETHIDTDANTCTSLIINQLLDHQFHGWAIAGAYGDNLYASAEKLADQHEVPKELRESLKYLGTCLNYNGYGFTTDDLVFHPADLFRAVQPYQNPLEFAQTDDFKKLSSAYDDDLHHTQELQPHKIEDNGAIYILPNEAWSRRVNGVFSNDLARGDTARAHAVLVECGENCYRVSVRAPLDNKTGADELCRQFETGGGRQAAAGINQLPATDLDRFSERFFAAF